MEYFNLNDGNRIPKIGFGTYKLNGSSGVFAIQAALKNGYRYLILLLIMKMKEQ